jgi:hypothetical protein
LYHVETILINIFSSNNYGNCDDKYFSNKRGQYNKIKQFNDHSSFFLGVLKTTSQANATGRGTICMYGHQYVFQYHSFSGFQISQIHYKKSTVALEVIITKETDKSNS